MQPEKYSLPEPEVLRLEVTLSREERQRLREEWQQAFHGPGPPIAFRVVDEDGVRQVVDPASQGTPPEAVQAACRHSRTFAGTLQQLWYRLLNWIRAGSNHDRSA